MDLAAAFIVQQRAAQLGLPPSGLVEPAAALGHVGDAGAGGAAHRLGQGIHGGLDQFQLGHGDADQLVAALIATSAALDGGHLLLQTHGGDDHGQEGLRRVDGGAGGVGRRATGLQGSDCGLPGLCLDVGIARRRHLVGAT